MATRRDVLRNGSIATACIGIGGTAPVVAPAASRPTRTVFDIRFGEARIFANAMAAGGAVANGFGGDVTAFWQDVLRPEWENSPATLAGMTTPHTLFCLERWAWDTGMRVVFRVDHRRMPDGSVDHHVATAVNGPALRRAVREMGGDYPRRMADLLVAGAYPQACCASAAGVGAPSHLPDPLVTWVIAPLSRA